MEPMKTIQHGPDERVFFFSDAHLGGHDSQTESLKIRALSGFVDYLLEVPASAVYIAGDLWDFGFEYKHCLPKELTRSLIELSRLVRAGVKVHFLGGNHDFWIEDFLKEQLGIDYHDGPIDVVLGGRKYFLAHGDGISSDDVGYRLLKRILRSRLLIFLYRSIHPDLGIPLAKWAAGLGRGEREVDPHFPALEEVARRKISEEGYRGAIFGHRHHPKQEALAGGEIIVIGDWIRRFSYLSYTGGELRLEYWSPPGRDKNESRPSP